jgi:predicted metal-dependent hydrolase
VEALWSGSIDGWEEPAPVERPRRPQLVPSPAATAPPVVESERSVADGAEPEAGPRPISELPVEVVRSANRRKSVSARIVDGRIVIRMPTWMSKAQEREYVTSLVAKLERQHSAKAVDLPERARMLARRYDLPEPTSIRWVGNQQQRWGSCTPSTGEIRISDRIAAFPEWVVDGVIVHELAHLVHLHHTKEFWALAHRYPKTERAYGFLIAKQLTDDEICS